MRKKRTTDRILILALILVVSAVCFKRLHQDFSPFPWLESGLRGNVEAFGGKGVGIAILDVFPMSRHASLALKPVSEWSRLRNIPDFRLQDDQVDHGTHVAGIVQRIAPDARMKMISITIDPYDFRQIIQQDVDVVNASAFVSGEWLVREIVEGLEKGMIFVMAAGNERYNLSRSGHMIRNILLRLEALRPELMHQVVIALNLNRLEVIGSKGRWKNLLPFFGHADHPHFALHDSSNVPGPFYAHVSIAAPGVMVESDLANGEQARMTGTSMAAPIVTGVIARLIEAYNERKGKPITTAQERCLRARLVVAALMRGAKKHQPSGSYLEPETFGQGVVDYEASLHYLNSLVREQEG